MEWYFKVPGAPIISGPFLDWKRDWHTYVVIPQPQFESVFMDTAGISLQEMLFGFRLI